LPASVAASQAAIRALIVSFGFLPFVPKMQEPFCVEASFFSCGFVL
jgi:hypothetical protein